MGGAMQGQMGGGMPMMQGQMGVGAMSMGGGMGGGNVGMPVGMGGGGDIIDQLAMPPPSIGGGFDPPGPGQNSAFPLLGASRAQ